MSTTDVLGEVEENVEADPSRPYVPPMLRPEGTPGLLPRTRPQRERRKPERYGDATK